MNQSGRRTAGTVSVEALPNEERTAPSQVLPGKKKPGLTSQFVGVCWDARMRKWRAQLCVGGKNRFLGIFDSEEEAGRAYLDAAPRREHTSSYLGVCWSTTHRKWRAEVRVDQQLHVLGYFKTEKDAAHAFVEARSRLRGGGE
jgi:hypothetical protein